MKSRTSALCHRTRAFGLLGQWSAGIIHHSPFTIHFSRLALCLLTAAVLCTSCARHEPPADLVILNGGERQPAPWGSTPGTGIWSEEPAVQGPWAPDPATLPWLSWKGTSGPRTPWWQTWQAGLAQGLPLWELLVLAVSMVAFVAALVAAAVPGYRGFGLLLMLPALGGVLLVEQRMRERLSGRAR